MTGQSGLENSARHIHRAFKKVRRFVRAHPLLEIHGTPHAVTVAMTSSKLDVRKLVDAMKKRGWTMQVNLSSVQYVIGERQADVIDEFCIDLDLSCEDVLKNPELYKETAALYGVADFLPGDNVDTFLGVYQEQILTPREEERSSSPRIG